MRPDPEACRDPDLLAAEVRRLRAVISAGEPHLTESEHDALEFAVETGRVAIHDDATLRKLLERLRAERRWIPLSELEPEEYATVMVFHKGEVYCGELRHPDGEEGWDDSWWMLFKYQFPQQNWCDMAFVDAGDRWMPLPEPPGTT
jgi:hypothetical protein